MHAGDQLRVTGRNADGSWLQVVDPGNPEGWLWIHAPLTDIKAATVQPLADVTVGEVEVATPPAPQPVAPTMSADCTRRHTVNPNETRLQQITDWFGRDLAATAVLNRIDPDTPLTAGMEICLPDAATVPQPQPGAQPQPAAPQPAAGSPCQTPIGPQPCLPIPDFPERAVKSVDRPAIHHAPGSYSRDLPGLDYDFELVFSDASVMWDWRVCDFEGCYDALRVYMGVPREDGLQRLELRLADPLSFDEFRAAIRADMWVAADIYDSPFVNPVTIPWSAYPWDPAALPHSDLAAVSYGCFRQPGGRALCDLMPMWGNSHSIHLHAAAADLLFEDSLAEYNPYSDRVLQANAYLFPLWDNGLGDPIGPGPCADVWRAG